MDLTNAVTGAWPFILIIATILTAVISAFLLWLFRRATLRGMGREVGALYQSPVESGMTPAGTASNNSPLAIESNHGEMPPTRSATADLAYRRTAQSLKWAAVVYIAGSLVYSLIMTTSWMTIAGDGFILGRFLLLFVSYAWPSVLVVNMVLATSRRDFLGITGVYFAFVLMISLYGLIQNSELAIDELIFFWIYVNVPGTIVLLAFLRRRVRAVGPLVLAFMVAATTGAVLATEIIRVNDALLENIVEVGVSFGLGGTAIYVLLNIIGFVAFGVLGWWFLGRIGRRYRAKRLSDQSLTMDSLMLLFAVVQTIIFAVEGSIWFFTGPVAFVGYKLVTIVGFALLQRQTENNPNAPMLLLLRVFELGSRSERFFDSFSKWWRRSGSVSLIAGPDLLTSIVQPHEFLDFVSGKLSRQFVQGKSDLERRFADLDKQADPDGRYRVNEFFCHADTWQMTMRQLAKESNGVLMDLRSFSPTNHGCIYELEQLLDIVDLERVVFLVDETTDRQFLEETLQHLWQGVDSRSPNYKTGSPTAYLFHVQDSSMRSIKPLLLRLLDARAALQSP